MLKKISMYYFRCFFGVLVNCLSLYYIHFLLSEDDMCMKFHGTYKFCWIITSQGHLRSTKTKLSESQWMYFMSKHFQNKSVKLYLNVRAV